MWGDIMTKTVQLLTKQELEKFKEWVNKASTSEESTRTRADMEAAGISNYHLYYMYLNKIPIPKSVATAWKMPKDTKTKKDEVVPEQQPIQNVEVAPMATKKKNTKKATKKATDPNRGKKTALIKKLINEAAISVNKIAEKADSTVLAVRTIKYNMKKNGELSAAAKKAPRAKAERKATSKKATKKAAPKKKAPAKKKAVKKKTAKKAAK